MAKYVLIYTGNEGAEGDSSSADEQMAVWTAWFGSKGVSVVDMGAPFGSSRQVSPSGEVSEIAPSGLMGYSIVETDGFDEAIAFAKGCPVIAGGGNVEVYEYINVG
jgi:hypothetical protein